MSDKNMGSLFIVAAPSGGGKTSLVQHVVQDVDNIAISISHTTRKMRPGEENGVDYFFISDDEFQQMIKNDAFVEYAQVFSNWYGTSIAQIHERLEAGIDIILDIDWQGAQQIKRLFANSVGIFIIPPSLEALKTRLQNRQQDANKIIQSRMQHAHQEISHYLEFDYLIVNDDFTQAATELRAIITAHRLRMSQQVIMQRKLLSFLLTNR